MPFIPAVGYMQTSPHHAMASTLPLAPMKKTSTATMLTCRARALQQTIQMMCYLTVGDSSTEAKAYTPIPRHSSPLVTNMPLQATVCFSSLATPHLFTQSFLSLIIPLQAYASPSPIATKAPLVSMAHYTLVT